VLDLFINFLRTGSTAGALMHEPSGGWTVDCDLVPTGGGGLQFRRPGYELASMSRRRQRVHLLLRHARRNLRLIIGWDLILEYVVSNAAVAVGFSGYSKRDWQLRH
jgi:hypothetical protein